MPSMPAVYVISMCFAIYDVVPFVKVIRSIFHRYGRFSVGVCTFSEN